jgi:hypothetical protein
MPNTNDSEQFQASVTQDILVRELAEWWDRGFGFVPLLGAGISVESGIPTLQRLVQYLAKVGCYIDNQVFSRSPRPTELPDIYHHDPSIYLREIGWPNINHLNAELWDWHDKKLGRGVTATDSLTKSVQSYLLTHLEQTEPDLAASINTDVSIKGDWKSLIGGLTSGNPEFSDTLFQNIIANRKPGQSHRFLAFLTDLLDWRLILTINFDNLIETALSLEGKKHTVYEITHDDLPPHASLVRNNLSVIKLHGGAFALRVGERLNYPLDFESKNRILAYLPRDPILLVMGCGGWDRRIMELAESVADDANSSGETLRVLWLHFEKSPALPVRKLVHRSKGRVKTCRVQDPSAFLSHLYCAIAHRHPVSAHPYQALLRVPTEQHSESENSGRRKNVHEEIEATKHPRSNLKKPIVPNSLLERSVNVHVFSNIGHYSKTGNSPLLTTRRIRNFLANYNQTHSVIWIDMATLDTVGGLVNELLSQFRLHDPDLAHAVLLSERNEPNKEATNRAVRLIHAALRRGTYVIILDGFEQFGRPPTVHHGLSESSVSKVVPNFKELKKFFLDLVQPAELLRESVLCIGVDAFKQRYDHGTPSDQYQDMRDSLEDLVDEIGELRNSTVYDLEPGDLWDALHKKAEAKFATLSKLVNTEPLKIGKYVIPHSLMPFLFGLAAMRRPRSIVAIYRIAVATVSVGEKSSCTHTEIDEITNYLVKFGFLQRLEGGFFWMDHRLRDRIYGAFTKNTRTGDIQRFRNEPSWSDDDSTLNTVRNQLCIIYRIHELLAKYYYDDVFLGSHDVVSFFEFLYHQVSTIRTATRISVMFRNVLPPAKQGDNIYDCLTVGTAFARNCMEPDPTGEWRLRGIRMLRNTLQRHENFTRTKLDSDTFLSWIKWLVADDLDRFSIRHFGITARKGKVETTIGREVASLKDTLRDSMANLYRNRAEFAKCINTRLHQIADSGWESLQNVILRSLPSEDTTIKIEKLVSVFGSKMFWSEIRSTAIRDCPEGRVILKRLIDISACLKSEELYEEASKILGEVKFFLRNREKSWDYVDYLFRIADLNLASAKPWSGMSSHVVSEELDCGLVIGQCNQGIELIEELQHESRSDDFKIYRCFFYSLKGRAMYLSGSFSDAYVELESAIAGLNVDYGRHRIAIAVSQLYLVECFMLRANDTISKYFQSVIKRTRRKCRVSKEGFLCVGFGGKSVHEDSFGKKIPQIAASTLDKLILRRNLIDYIGGDAEKFASTGLLEESYKLFESFTKDDRNVVKFRGKLISDGQLRAKEMVEKAFAYSENVCFEGEGKSRADFLLVGRKSYRRLERAKLVLEKCTSLLAEWQRNSFWWHFYYQLSAQLEVERLLFFITFGPLPWTSGVEGKHLFAANFTGSMETGLGAVRNGLDHIRKVVSGGSSVGTAGDSREKSLTRLWIQLMVCGFVLTKLRQFRNKKKDRFDLDDLWEIWTNYNRSTDLRKFVKSKPMFIPILEKYETKFEECTKGKYGMESRKFAIRLMNDALLAGGVQYLKLLR